MNDKRIFAKVLAGILLVTGVSLGAAAPAQAADSGWNGTRIAPTADSGWNGTR
jgi:hypothetical protein